MIKEVVYSVLFDNPKKPIGPKNGPKNTWLTSYPNKLDFKYIDEYLKELGKSGAIYAKITTHTVEVDENDYFDFNKAIKETVYEWYGGKPIVKIKEIQFN